MAGEERKDIWTKSTCLLALILAPFVLLQWLIDDTYEKRQNEAKREER